MWTEKERPPLENPELSKVPSTLLRGRPEFSRDNFICCQEFCFSNFCVSVSFKSISPILSKRKVMSGLNREQDFNLLFDDLYSALIFMDTFRSVSYTHLRAHET